ncbi:MAG: hypothetical protein HWD61_03835 [Parachlamydiaceae bacterium]|nr:MAG: hypothetical protein HWD61_03835 [Parachlamydiaceae bacterium]
MTALHLAVKDEDFDLIDIRLAILNCLLKHDADPNIPDKFNHLPLHDAILHADPKFVKILASVTDLNFQNNEPLLHLCFERYLQDENENDFAKRIKSLIKKGADIKASAVDGTSFVHWIFECEIPKNEVIEDLLDFYLDQDDISASDQDGDTALHYIVRKIKNGFRTFWLEIEVW